ncbi:Protein FDD123 [Paramyrothecium foliicola]|nr:Protein FDD123 [Paramyrothecium foliicola]
MPNNALQDNAPVFQHANLEITRRGSDWLYAVCAIMGASTLAVMAWSFAKPKTHRLFHYLSAALLFTATVAYFSMGSNLGQVPIQVEFVRGGKVASAGTREIFYVRYIDWFVTTPLLLLDLLLTAGLPWPTILITILADEFMVVCGLVGALTQTSYKWGYFVFSCAAFLFVAYTLVIDGRAHARALGGSISRTYNICGVLTIFIWFMYPIAWGVSEGGNVIHPDSEAIFYGILDVIAKPVFTFLLLWGHRTIDPAALGLHMREPGAHHGGVEKEHYGDHGHIGSQQAARNGVHNGTHNGVGHNGVTGTQGTTATGAV